MNYQILCQKRDTLNKVLGMIQREVFQNFEKSFEIEYAHNSTAIEGNTLSLIQAKTVLEDGISVGGKMPIFGNDSRLGGTTSG